MMNVDRCRYVDDDAVEPARCVAVGYFEVPTWATLKRLNEFREYDVQVRHRPTRRPLRQETEHR